MVQPVLTKALLQPTKAAVMCTAPRAEIRPPPPIPHSVYVCEAHLQLIYTCEAHLNSSYGYEAHSQSKCEIYRISIIY